MKVGFDSKYYAKLCVLKNSKKRSAQYAVNSLVKDIKKKLFLGEGTFSSHFYTYFILLFPCEKLFFFFVKLNARDRNFSRSHLTLTLSAPGVVRVVNTKQK